MNVLELFSGIGGMHMALEESGVEGKVVASVDINQWANKVYAHNFPDTKLLNQNIQGISAASINKLKVDTILMSPPCQPFTRNGLQKDVNDPRTNPFVRVIDILKDLKVHRILIENVKGFEKSQMRDILVDKLIENGFKYQEFILSPTQVGVTNTRHRYYCLAKKQPHEFSFDTGEIRESLPNQTKSFNLHPIEDILEPNIGMESHRIPLKTLAKRVKILDICYDDSQRSCCFTKSYGRFLEGTGSVYCQQTPEELGECIKKLDETLEEHDKIEVCKDLKLRFFTPKEISRLMSFPEKFSFPAELSTKQKYMLLGNSINVKVVSELIKLLDNKPNV